MDGGFNQINMRACEKKIGGEFCICLSRIYYIGVLAESEYSTEVQNITQNRRSDLDDVLLKIPRSAADSLEAAGNWQIILVDTQSYT